MTSDTTEGASTVQYDLVCVDCTYETTVEGNFLDALEVADGHQEETDEPEEDHFVNIEHDGRS